MIFPCSFDIFHIFVDFCSKRFGRWLGGGSGEARARLGGGSGVARGRLGEVPGQFRFIFVGIDLFFADLKWLLCFFFAVTGKI